jgi:hypothetical protein
VALSHSSVYTKKGGVIRRSCDESNLSPTLLLTLLDPKAPLTVTKGATTMFLVTNEVSLGEKKSLSCFGSVIDVFLD